MPLSLNAKLIDREDNKFVVLEGPFNLEFARKYLLPLVPYTFVALDSGEGFSKEKNGNVSYPVKSKEEAAKIIANLSGRFGVDKYECVIENLV